ncbi:MAG TPA: hypothetical protein VIJ86_09105 [Acidimicrobiales bacterium]
MNMSIKKLFMRRKVVVVGAAVALTLGISGAAFAFFTSSGTGTGTGVVGNAGAFVITTASPSGYLYPDTAGNNKNVETTDYTVTNSGGGNAQLTQVTISVATSGGGTWTYTDPAGDPACTAADFSIDGAPVGTSFVDTSQAGTYAGGQAQTGSFTLEMIDNGQNQNSCEGLTVPIYLTTVVPPVTGVITGNDLGNTTLYGAEPNDTGGFFPNPSYVTIPTVTSGTPVSLNVGIYQPNGVQSSGSISVSYDNAFLTFTGTSADGACGTVTTVGTNSSVTCTFTDLSHSAVSKPFNFTTAGSGTTTATATVTLGSDNASETFGLTIS